MNVEWRLAVIGIAITCLCLASRAFNEQPLASSALALQIGDVDCSARVDAEDALLILQLHAGVVSTLPCAENADARTDGVVDSRDSTLILQYVAGLLDHVGPPEYQMRVSSANANVGSSANVAVELRGVQPPGLSRLIVTLTYDPRTIRLVLCMPTQPGEVCATANDNVVWLVRNSGPGLIGDLSLASIRFQCVAGGESRLDLDTEVFAEPTAHPRQLDISFEHGHISCGS